ncbi:MAG: MBL fold metallo-hydrolase [Desulfobacteraceae bacterium]|nr:MBL fold metallo-hydrolase [Desulfobacteraceae bacterium]MCF8094322.1 MBL fold metallo-hydrolase [Desulfobacteraceae bacterium]
MRITILYDNDSRDGRLESDWGFAALIEVFGRNILFDTGAKGRLLLDNMNRLGVFPKSIDEVFISHDHWDHTGGLAKVHEQKKVPVYIPDTIVKPVPSLETVSVSRPAEIHENIYSTGTLRNIEQSMCIRHKDKLLVVVGCSHPGVETILSAASEFGRPSALIGGLHGFSNFSAISSLDLVCSTHCTKHKREILSAFPEIAVSGGAGKVIEI